MNNYYNEETHEYFVDNIKKPSVTEIAQPISFTSLQKIPNQILERKREIGSRVHEMIETYLLCEEIDDENQPVEVLNYFYSFVEWFKTYRPKVLFTEHIMFSNDYCGTCDLVCELDGKVILVDYKTTSVIDKKSLSVQLYGYDVLLQQEGIKVEDTYVLQLKKDGYVFKPIEENERWFNILLEHYKYMKGDKNGK